MIDRKTIRYPDGSVELKCSIDEVVIQLAEYEDTGRTPEEIDTLNQRLDENIGSSRVWRRRYYSLLAGKQNTTTQHIKELLEAEQEGRLLVSPIVLTEKQYASPCEYCSNNPANGGSGICHCTLGTTITY